MKRNLVEIDGKRLEKAITSRGITLSFAANELGYADGFFRNCTSRNSINKAAVIGLSNRFGIQFEEYERLPEPEVLKVMQEEIKPDDLGAKKLVEAISEAGFIDYQKLYATVYKAVLEAIVKAREL